MDPMSRIRFSSGSPVAHNMLVPHARPPSAQASTTRATSTTPAASASSFTPRGGAPTRSSGTPSGPHQPGAPRRLRLRSQYRRRRRHPDPDAGSILPQGSGPTADAAARRGLRTAPALCSCRRTPTPARAVDDDDRTDRGGGRAAAARLARRADRRQRARSARGRGGADLQAALRRPRRRRQRPTTAFERKLYVIRKRIEHAVDALGLSPEAQQSFYIVSLSSRTLIYKGMLTASQIAPLFLDLADETVESALALVHQRFSTNTFPSWPLAHPYRYVAHNGEINTLRGNINWMKAREALLQSDVLGDDLKKVLPIIREGGSDTATFDNVLEFLVMAGRSLAARRADDDSGAVAEPREHQPGAARVLRVPLVADGAVGRSGVDRVHRRHGDRRGARSQRAAAVALLRHEGRPGRAGVGSRRPRHSARGHRRQGAAAPGTDVPGRHRAGAHHLGRRDQGSAGARASVRASG